MDLFSWNCCNTSYCRAALACIQSEPSVLDWIAYKGPSRRNCSIGYQVLLIFLPQRTASQIFSTSSLVSLNASQLPHALTISLPMACGPDPAFILGRNAFSVGSNASVSLRKVLLIFIFMAFWGTLHNRCIHNMLVLVQAQRPYF